MEDRLGPGLFLNSGSYYNLGISEAQCIKDNIGQSCKDKTGEKEKDGVCVMLNTDRMLRKDLSDWQVGNRETLHTICLADDNGLRRNNYELRMMWGDEIVYCDKSTNLITHTLPKLKVTYKSLKSFTD
jgi:hypothetical protein